MALPPVVNFQITPIQVFAIGLTVAPVLITGANASIANKKRRLGYILATVIACARQELCFRQVQRHVPVRMAVER